jgi:hypothetical protein
VTYYPDDHPVFDQPEFNPEPPDEEPDDSGYEPNDPKHPSYHDRMSAIWDEREGK